MEVETYEVLGINVRANGTVFNEVLDPEAMALVESLNLKGQTRWTQTAEANDEEVVSRLPYRRIEAREVVVFRTLFPTEVRLDAYSAEPLPLRVLQVAADAISRGLDLFVWCPNDSTADDPVLIGRRSDPEFKWRKETLLLARWGQALLPYEELEAKARKIIHAKAKLAVAAAKAELAALEASLTEQVDLWVQGETTVPNVITSRFTIPTAN